MRRMESGNLLSVMNTVVPRVEIGLIDLCHTS